MTDGKSQVSRVKLLPYFRLVLIYTDRISWLKDVGLGCGSRGLNSTKLHSEVLLHIHRFCLKHGSALSLLTTPRGIQEDIIFYLRLLYAHERLFSVTNIFWEDEHITRSEKGLWTFIKKLYYSIKGSWLLLNQRLMTFTKKKKEKMTERTFFIYIVLSF